MKEYPSFISLKAEKCPECEKKMDHPRLEPAGDLVKAFCRTEDCDYSVDLFFMGDAGELGAAAA